MGIWLLLLCTGILAELEGALVSDHSKSKDFFIKRNLLGAQLELAKSFSHREKESLHLLNLSTTEPWTAKVGYDGARSFWAFGQTLILADSSIYRLEETDVVSLKLTEVAKLPEMLLVDRMVFIEVVEWRRILFLMVAFNSDRCKIYTATPSMKITERQKINHVGARDGEFFVHGNDLFLVVVSSIPEHYDVPSTIYRWTGTHFDSVQTFMTSGAIAVSTFQNKGAVIITVAQYPHDKPTIGSQVFRWANNKLERMQFLATNGPVALQYLEAYGDSYLLVINDFEFSSLYWWKGREFVVWDNFYDVKGMRKISIGYAEGETLVLVAMHDKIEVFRLLESRLHRLTTVSLDGEEILSMSIHTDENPKLITISRKNRALSTSVFHLQLVKGSYGNNRQILDPLLHCLLSLNDKLLSRQSDTENLALKLPKVLSVKSNVLFRGRLVVDGMVFIRKAILKTVKSGGEVNSLLSTALHISGKLNTNEELVTQMRKTVSQLVKKSYPGLITGKIFVQDFVMANGVLEELNVVNVNEKMFNSSNMLWYSGNQKIPGTIVLNTLITDKMESETLNGLPLEDLLLNYGNQQVSGYHKAKEIRCSNLKIMDKEIINNVNLNSLVTKDRRTVRGHKKFHGLWTNNLVTSFLLNENITNIKERLVCKTGGEYSLKELNFKSRLVIESLDVSSLNEIQWDSFKEAVFLNGRNQVINGSLWFKEKLTTDDISVGYINGVSPSALMTCSTEQNISSLIKVNVLKAKDIIAVLCNNLDIDMDVGRMGRENYVAGTVRMFEVQVVNVTTERDTVWIGLLKPNEIRQSHIYEGPLVVPGNFLVDDLLLRVGGIQVNGSFIDMSLLKKMYLMANTKEVTALTVHAKSFKILGDLHTEKVNGEEVAYIIHVGSTTEVNGINFGNVTVAEFNVENSVTVSGIDLDNLFRSTVINQGEFYVRGHKSFIGGIVVGNLETKWMNNLDLTLMVPLNKQLVNLGNKIFNEVHIRGDITADDIVDVYYINDLNLTSLLDSVVRIDQPFELHSIELSTTTGDSIGVTMLDKINFNHFVKSFNSTLPIITIKEVKINGEVEFSGPLDVGILNGLSICSYLSDVVNRKIGGYIKGQKTFVRNVTVKDSLKSDMLNNVDMISLEKYYFSKTKDQVVTGYFVLKTLSLIDLEAAEINGKQMNVLSVKESDPEVINSNLRFLGMYLDADLEVPILNGCDIMKVGKYLSDAVEITHFQQLKVTQQVSWNTESPHKKSLSHLFTKAVNNKYENVIDGEVTFSGHVYTQFMSTHGDLSGIDLKFLASDCATKSAKEQVLKGHKVFVSSANTSRVEVINNANIKSINGYDLPYLDKNIVIKVGEQEIKGHKTFLNGFYANKLQCGGKVGGISTANIVTAGSDSLPAVEVESLSISDNFKFTTVNSLSFSDLLKERITCDGNEEIAVSFMFTGNLVLKGSTKLSSVNRINPSNIMLLNNEFPQEVAGKKVFKQSILIEGDIDVGLVNSIDLKEEYALGLLGNEDVEIHGNVVFASGSVMNANLDTKYLTNGMDLAHVYESAIKNFERDMDDEQSYYIKIQQMVEESFDLCKVTANEFMYLDSGGKTNNLANATSSNGNVDVVMIIGMDRGNCGLPEDCLCPKQYEVRVFDGEFTFMPPVSHQRHFKMYDHSHIRGAELFSNTISRDSHCKQSHENLRNEFNKVLWMTLDNDTGKLIHDFNVDAYTFDGYVTDAKSFSIGSDFYVVIAELYDAMKFSHNVDSFVLKWSLEGTEAKVIQHIPTFGATVLEIFHRKMGIYLFIGNSYDSDLKTKDVNDEIYRFHEEKEQFILLRKIPTAGTNSAKSLTVNGETLIIKGQDFNAPIAVYKYNEEYDNFYFYQNLHFQGNTLGVGVFYVGGSSVYDGFVAIAASDETIQIYKYNYIEGFKRVWRQRQKGIQNLKPFSIGKEEFILSLTLSGIKVLRVVMQGS